MARKPPGGLDFTAGVANPDLELLFPFENGFELGRPFEGRSAHHAVSLLGACLPGEGTGYVFPRG